MRMCDATTREGAIPCPVPAPFPRAVRRYAFFLSYYRDEAGGTARYLQAVLQRQIRRPVFLDATDADAIDLILSRGVGRSDCLLLLQTATVLTRPWVPPRVASPREAAAS